MELVGRQTTAPGASQPSRKSTWQGPSGHRPLSGLDDEGQAAREHDGWCEEKLRTGWRRGEPRDDALKHHQDLVPWDELTATSRDKDRHLVREIPVLLARAGFEIYRPCSPQAPDAERAARRDQPSRVA